MQDGPVYKSTHGQSTDLGNLGMCGPKVGSKFLPMTNSLNYFAMYLIMLLKVK